MQQAGVHQMGARTDGPHSALKLGIHECKQDALVGVCLRDREREEKTGFEPRRAEQLWSQSGGPRPPGPGSDGSKEELEDVGTQ